MDTQTALRQVLEAGYSADDIAQAQADIIDVVERNPKEAQAVLAALEGGRVAGNEYFGECSCLFGTIAKARLSHPLSAREWILLHELAFYGREADSDSAAERWFTHIHPGDTPDTSPWSHLAHHWIREWAGARGLLK